MALNITEISPGSGLGPRVDLPGGSRADYQTGIANVEPTEICAPGGVDWRALHETQA